ncbi:hypothetical protein 1 [Wenling crustacean virus 2]|uniref:hypothetical protein 1 n=1 Tax=Wenling crustacean virus 2 TaxID=1923485 RepID=UPI00090A13FD|nr:hypothetical protein 1 [Wenling crustacean virus 2]APG78483.1 hypothetical protein 1 [Wenling crustacean virus 2]
MAHQSKQIINGNKDLYSLSLEYLLTKYHPSQNRVLKNLEKKYLHAYLANDFRSCTNYLRTSQKQSNKKMRGLKFEAQSLTDWIPGVQQMSEIKNTITQFANKGSQCFDQVSEMLNNISNYFSNDNEMMKRVASILSATTLLYQAERSVISVTAYLVNIASQFNISATVIQNIFSKWMNKTGLVAQSGEEMEEEEPIRVFGAIIETLSSILDLAPNVEELTKTLTNVGRSAVGGEKIIRYVTHALIWLRDLFYKSRYGYSYKEYKEMMDFPKLKSFIASCQILLEIDDSFIDTNSEICHLIQVVNRMGHTLLEEARKESQLRTYILSLLRTILPVVEKAKRSPANAKTNRNVPFAIYMYGNAGVGKTNLMHIIMANIYKEYVKNYVPGFMNCYHSRKAENEYYDGYLRQPFILYDDIFQLKDLPSSPNPELMEIIRTINDDPYQLHMASIEDKKSTYMDSDYVLATSNVKVPVLQSISCPDAVFRRFKSAIEVTVDPKFGKQVVSVSGNQYYKVDPSKVKNELNTEFYILREYNMHTGQTIQEYTFEEYINHIFNMINEHRDHHSSRVTLLRELAGEQTVNATESANQQFAEKLRTALKGNLEAQNSSQIQENESESITERLLSALQGYKEKLSMHVDTFMPYFDSTKDYIAKLRTRVFDVASQATKIFKEHLEKAIDYIKENILILILPVIGIAGYFLYKYYQCPLLKLNKPVDIYTMKSCKCERCVYIQKMIKASEGLVKVEERHGEAMKIFGLLFSKYPDKDLIQKFSPMLIFRGNTNERIYKEIKAETSGDFTTLKSKSELKSEQNSGDFLTQKTNKGLKSEYASGDFITKKGINQFLAEVASGDFETRKNVVNMIAEHSSGDFETFKRQTAFLTAETDNLSEMKNAVQVGDKLIAQVGDLGFIEQHQATMLRNAVLLKSSDQKSVINAVFVTGRTVLVPYHFYDVAIRNNETFTLTNPFQQNLSTPIMKDQCFFHRCVDKFGEHTDAMLISLPLSIPSRPNIIEKFCKAQDFNKLDEGEVVLCGLNTINGMTVVKTNTATEHHVESSQVEYPDSVGNIHKINQIIAYNMTTRAGDCGSLLFARNSLLVGKILGIHVAGDTKAGYGVSLAISRENLSRNILCFAEKVNDKRQFVSGSFEAQMAIVDPELAYKHLGELGDYLPIGPLDRKMNRPNKTVLNKSLIHEEVYKTETKPAYLAPVIRDGVKIDPLLKGIKKVCNVLPTVNTHILDIAVHDTLKQFKNTESDIKRVLTYEEALKGVEDVEFAAPINRSTSPGYPYSLDNPQGGKHEWLGYDNEWIVDNPKLLNDVTEIIEKAKENKRSKVVFTATLKDERRPIAKVEELKTRVFEAAPLPYVVAMRQYYLGFVEHVMRNRIKNEVCVGTNHLSMDWHRIGMKLTSKGDKVIAGDFSNFDGTLHQQILWRINDIINNWYDGTEEENQVRNVLFEEVCNTIVNLDGFLIQQTHSQPSGNPLTVIINSIYNQIVMRYAYLLCKKEAKLPMMCDFTQKVGFVTYGDDNAANISADIVDWYNQETITAALATIGLTYTDEAKTGIITQYRALSDINFLKRKFVKDIWGFWKAPILINVPRDMANWVRGKQLKASTALNVEASLIEFALHGEEVYNDETQKLIVACEKQGVTVNVPHFLEWQEFFAFHRNIGCYN